MSSTHVFYLAPTGPGVGLTSVALGLMHALDREGLRVGFFKPLAQAGAEGEPEPSTHFVRATTTVRPPEPLPLARAEALLGDGRAAQLLEEVVAGFERAADGAEVVIVEGLAATPDAVQVERLNADIVRALDAEVILVGAVGKGSLEAFCQRVELAAGLFGGAEQARVLGCVVNKLGEPEQVVGSNRALLSSSHTNLGAAALESSCELFRRPDFRLLGAVPWEPSLVSPRTLDVARHLGARILHRGELERRRVVDVSLCARTVANLTHRLRPAALIVTPGDRDDVILAASMAALGGVPLAGLLLTGGIEPNANVMTLCRRAFDTGLPVLLVDTDSYVTAAEGAAMSLEVPFDDIDRVERVMEAVAGHLDSEWLKARCATDLEPRLSPAAFMYRLVQRARRADKLIVLPEGDEPRTVSAAVACVERGIARCLLLAERSSVAAVAEAQGLALPPGLEIVDPSGVRGRYVAPMVELRRHKGLNEPMAREQLVDNVVLGTMMLAQGEVDGLVSGAVHTTANTVRPALQLIKTRPGAKLISSVFFMCLPEQVLVYGDCAINPDPNAEELADIAVQSAESAEFFGIAPRVAMISYSTGSSGSGADVDKVREATRIARELRPDLLIDGPLQYDAASVRSVGATKAPGSPVAGRATVIVFPDLNTGNTTYKAVQRSANVISIGPMLQGLRRPVNDLSRGALVEDIIYTIALTAVQASQAEAWT